MLFYTLWTGIFLYSFFLLLGGLIFYLNTQRRFKVKDPDREFSIIIPFRNEEENLTSLLESLNKINYPVDKFEIILVDDHSEDEGRTIATELIYHSPAPISLINCGDKEHGKKAALALGIEHSNYRWILTIDADCIVPPELLNMYNSVQKNHVKLIAGPVVYKTRKFSLIQNYQVIENAGLIVLGALGIKLKRPFIANGANLCFEKEAYHSVFGYDDNLHIAGGDDEFLLEKIHNQFPDSVHFLFKNKALVRTRVQPDFQSMFSQRIRWAGKSKSKKSKGTFAAQFLMFLLFTGILCLFAASFIDDRFLFVRYIILVKLIADFLFFILIMGFFRIRHKILFVPLSSVLQLIFIPVLALVSLFGKFSWKGRLYKS